MTDDLRDMIFNEGLSENKVYELISKQGSDTQNEIWDYFVETYDLDLQSRIELISHVVGS